MSRDNSQEERDLEEKQISAPASWPSSSQLPSSYVERVQRTKEHVVNKGLLMGIKHLAKTKGQQLRVDEAIVVADDDADAMNNNNNNNMIVRFSVHCANESVLAKVIEFIDIYVKKKQGQLMKVDTMQGDKDATAPAVVKLKSITYDVYIEMIITVNKEEEDTVRRAVRTLINNVKKNMNMNNSESTNVVKVVADEIVRGMDEKEDKVDTIAFVVAMYRLDASLKQDDMRGMQTNREVADIKQGVMNGGRRR